MACRPKVNEGIGEKSEFKKLGMSLRSHKDAEFEEDDNIFKIVLKCSEDVRSIFNLFHYDREGKEFELKTSVFIDMKDDTLKYKVAVNEVGWYKLNIFATPTSNKTNSLPCVFTYLFYVNNVRKRAFPYPKQFADWKKGDELHCPKFIDPTDDLHKVKFEVTVPEAKKVAAKMEDQWFHLEEKGRGKWVGDLNLNRYQQVSQKSGGPLPTLSLNACTGDDETSYATLIQYIF